MAIDIINNGNFDDDPSAESVRSGFGKVNTNFDDVRQNRSKEREAETLLELDAEIFRIYNNSLYKFIGSFVSGEYITSDIDAEILAGDWQAVLTSGSGSGLAPFTFTGNVIPVDDANVGYNTASVNSFTSYTLSGTAALGAIRKIRINTTSQPTVTGATLVSGDFWIPNNDMQLNLEVQDGRTIYYFLND